MKQNNKILFLTRLYHPHIGGVEKHVEEVSWRLSRKGVNLIIITEQFDTRLPQHEFYNRVEIYRIPVSKNLFLKKFFIWRWMFLHLGLLLGPDIIHVHDVFFWIMPFRPFLFFKKIYITFHGYEGYPVKIRWRILRKASEMLANGSICVGDFMVKWYFARPTSVIYGGVKLINQTTTVNSQSAVFFGRLDDQTGISQYLEAYKLIKKKYSKFRLTIIGEGKFCTKIPDNVAILPFDPDIEKHISGHRFIFVSRYLSMLEALVQKREVVAIYDNPIKKDYLLMSPFKEYVYIGKNPKDIADFVIKSMKSKDRNKKMIEAGCLWAKKQTWEKIATAYLSLWKIIS